MILHLLRMCRNINRNVFNHQKNVSVTTVIYLRVLQGNSMSLKQVHLIHPSIVCHVVWFILSQDVCHKMSIKILGSF